MVYLLVYSSYFYQGRHGLFDSIQFFLFLLAKVLIDYLLVYSSDFNILSCTELC